ncbi:ABC transporter transmembrane domain-containing protein [Paenibacillus allorhizosphaerae]|uniref:ABC transporter transmembrane domain-containing protein n=1 Tax=Paenibacillus allorhizosphaerae TaxID=2849866 RepID=UPI002E794793|nr:ABC transporter transmembrane domain-containing protein [Paenibacillus allorhizosphaerae]
MHEELGEWILARLAQPVANLGNGRAFALQVVSGGILFYLLHYGGNKIVSAIRDRLWRKLLRMPVSSYDSRETGETISRLKIRAGEVCGNRDVTTKV